MITTLIAASLLVSDQDRTSLVEYRDAKGTVCEAVVATPANPSKNAPWVIILHDWDGLNDHEIGVAKKLAEAGYYAFAADIYGKGVRPKTTADNSAEAAKYYKDPGLYKQRIEAALKAAAGLSGGDHRRTAAIGYCFGGTGVLTAARSNMNLKAVVAFHGGLKPLESVSGLYRPRILVCHGSADGFENENLPGFIKEMKAHARRWKLAEYSGAKHAFTVKGSDAMKNPNVGYQERADKESWAAMLDWFSTHL